MQHPLVSASIFLSGGPFSQHILKTVTKLLQIDTKTQIARLLPRDIPPGHWEKLDDVIQRSAQPDLILNHLTRMSELAPVPMTEVLSTDVGRTCLTTIAAVSQSLTRWLQAHPDKLRALADDRFLTPLPKISTLRAEITAEITAVTHPSQKQESVARATEALRSFRTMKFLRIALRDLLHVATLQETGSCLSDLADASIDNALRIARLLHLGTPIDTPFGAECPGVIAMGKLGGRELNYASDVDILFVSPDQESARTQLPLTRSFLEIMSGPNQGSIIWRVDTNLRPEGRIGVLIRSLDSYLNYYTHWAKQWEFQALIKRRTCAGNMEIAENFVTDTTHFVYPETLDPDGIEELRAMKDRAERLVQQNGLHDREVKLGPGGIRDIEFAIQLLQLVHGRHDVSIRSPNTLTALEELTNSGYIHENDREILTNSYIKLRTIEHRLQLKYEQQTHVLPSTADETENLAKILEYRPDSATSAAEKFLSDYRQAITIVRSVHIRLFYRPLLEAFTGKPQILTGKAAEERLRAFGFGNTAATYRLLDSLVTGFSRHSKLMEAMLPLLLEWLSASPNPDMGLLFIERLSSRPHTQKLLTSLFRESASAAQRLCLICGSSRRIGAQFSHYPELLQILDHDTQLQLSQTQEDFLAKAAKQLSWRSSLPEQSKGFCRFVQREEMRIGIRDLLGFTDTATVSHELSALSDACLRTAFHTAWQMQIAENPSLPPIAIIAMGRLGGKELCYNSDLDILLVHGDDTGKTASEANHFALLFAQLISSPTERGTAFDLDLGLRPEGKNGVLTRSVHSYVRYWERWAQTWEFQALLRARFVAGDETLGQRFLESARPFVYTDDPFASERIIDIRKMKARIEKERRPHERDRFHIKLGKGGMLDIEFAVQTLQLQYGRRTPSIRTPSTLAAIDRLCEAGYLTPTNANRLRDAYQFLTRLRNVLYLYGAKHTENLSLDALEQARIARMMGIEHEPSSQLREQFRELTRKAYSASHAVFYPDDM